MLTQYAFTVHQSGCQKEVNTKTDTHTDARSHTHAHSRTRIIISAVPCSGLLCHKAAWAHECMNYEKKRFCLDFLT